MKINNISKLITSLLACQLAGIIGMVFTSPSIPTWYKTLIKPPLQPPNWIFGPVWFVLYIMMGISIYVIWTSQGRSKDKQKAVYVFLTQLALNTLWSIIFFGAHMTLLAFIEIVLIWAAILYTILLFRKISGLAAYLLVPYLLWVSFASYLNLAIWILNR